MKAIKLDETVCVGRLATLEDVWRLLDGLDDLEVRDRPTWVIRSRQTRELITRNEEERKGKLWIA